MHFNLVKFFHLYFWGTKNKRFFNELQFQMSYELLDTIQTQQFFLLKTICFKNNVDKEICDNLPEFEDKERLNS